MTPPLQLGWREWVSLPDLEVPWVKAKVDTGARTSALHAFYIEPFQQDNKEWVRFGVHPVQGDFETVIHCSAPLLDERDVTDSGGHREKRPVILTTLVMGSETRTIEMTLTDRDSMRFRMLIGRTAMNQGVMVCPGNSFKLGGNRLRPPEAIS